VKESVWLSGRVGSFAEAQAILQRVGHVSMSSSTIWRRVEKWGEEFKGLVQKRQEQVRVLPSGDQVMKGETKQRGRKGVAMDGAMVHLREEGWKELKVGCVFDIETQAEFDKASGEQIERGHAVNNSYVAHLGGQKILVIYSGQKHKRVAGNRFMKPKASAMGPVGFGIWPMNISLIAYRPSTGTMPPNIFTWLLNSNIPVMNLP
jgi:hypothetical protein